MKPLSTFEDAHHKLLKDIHHFLTTARQQSSLSFTTVENGIHILDSLRKSTYEDLNQIQHEHMIIRAAEWLLANQKCTPEIQWFWNPRQTGGKSEPDLRGSHAGVVVISAEITTSEKPVGTIDSRMQETLKKLAEMQGIKYYFVRTPQMQRRAKTKITKGEWEIEVVLIAF